MPRRADCANLSRPAGGHRRCLRGGQLRPADLLILEDREGGSEGTQGSGIEEAVIAVGE